MHRWQFHTQWQQHARRSSMLGGAAFSGVHSMPRESSMPGEAASFRGTQHAQGELHVRGSNMLRGTHHIKGEQHSRRSSMLRGTHHARGSSMPGEAACSGGQHKRAIHSSSSISCQGSLYNSFTVCCSPGNAAPPAPKVCCPRVYCSPCACCPFWACRCPLGLLLPLWKASKKANLLQSRFILLIIILILKKR
jgi:hypothetical protein